ncbi:TIGR04086 family membrane protein [Paenibacillus sp. KN14-4R]|uniref:TIGR04086 family membrane protein n=1 Tax=Paenibacillus sp. KN14-4R TaxID=3445773 RepID=UPI003F9F26D4
MNPINKVSQARVMSPILSGLIYAFVIMFAGTLFTSLILLLTSANESNLPAFSYINHIISLLVGGWVAGKKSGTKGWYYGGMLGCIYTLIIFMIAFLSFDAGLNGRSFLLLCVSLLSAGIGGIFGVNSRK